MVTDASPGTRFLLLAGKRYREAPLLNGPFVDQAAEGECRRPDVSSGVPRQLPRW